MTYPVHTRRASLIVALVATAGASAAALPTSAHAALVDVPSVVSITELDSTLRPTTDPIVAPIDALLPAPVVRPTLDEVAPSIDETTAQLGSSIDQALAPTPLAPIIEPVLAPVVAARPTLDVVGSDPHGRSLGGTAQDEPSRRAATSRAPRPGLGSGDLDARTRSSSAPVIPGSSIPGPDLPPRRPEVFAPTASIQQPLAVHSLGTGGDRGAGAPAPGGAAFTGSFLTIPAPPIAAKPVTVDTDHARGPPAGEVPTRPD